MATTTSSDLEQEYRHTPSDEMAGSVHLLSRTDRFERALTLIEIATDAGAVILATWLAFSVYVAAGLGHHVQYHAGAEWMMGIALATAFALLLEREGEYRRSNSLLRVRETERILRVTTYVFLLVLPILYMMGEFISRWAMALALIFSACALCLQNHLRYTLLERLHSGGVGVHKVVIYGAGTTGHGVYSVLARSPKLGLEPVAVVDDNPALEGRQLTAPGYTHTKAVPIVAGPLTPEMLKRYGADIAIVAIPSLNRERFRKIVEQMSETGNSVAFSPLREINKPFPTDFLSLDGVMLCTIGKRRDHDDAYKLIKRAFDFVAAAVLVLLTAPVWASSAMLVLLDSPGPVLFTQIRVGKHGKLFKLYKFRSMHVDAPAYAYSPKMGTDPRVTRIGRWLRKTSIDELPQLLNVLKGDMALVGPRPEMPFIVQSYTPYQWQRLAVRPGITGLWQLSADRAFLIHENLHYDLYYINNRNFFMDIAILLHTAVFAMRGV